MWDEAFHGRLPPNVTVCELFIYSVEWLSNMIYVVVIVSQIFQSVTNQIKLFTDYISFLICYSMK